MTAPQTDIHSKNVEDWFKLNAKNLSPTQQILLLEKAINAIEERACVTLSSITLMVVLDRVLHEGQQKFQLLSQVTLDQHFMNFKAVDKEKNTEETIAALTNLLVELFRVLARLTAHILAQPLHNELMKVTSIDSGES